MICPLAHVYNKVLSGNKQHHFQIGKSSTPWLPSGSLTSKCHDALVGCSFFAKGAPKATLRNSNIAQNGTSSKPAFRSIVMSTSSIHHCTLLIQIFHVHTCLALSVDGIECVATWSSVHATWMMLHYWLKFVSKKVSLVRKLGSSLFLKTPEHRLH